MLVTKEYLKQEIKKLNNVIPCIGYTAEVNDGLDGLYISLLDKDGNHLSDEQFFTARDVVEHRLNRELAEALLDGEWNASGHKFETFEGAKDYAMEKDIPQFSILCNLVGILKNMELYMVPDPYNKDRYLMSAWEIEAAYRFRQLQYRTEDATDQMEWFIYEQNPDSLNAKEAKEAERKFEEKYGISVKEAHTYDEDIARQFIDEHDCSVDENSQFQSILEDHFSKIKNS